MINANSLLTRFRRFAASPSARLSNRLNRGFTAYPQASTAFELFEGEWSSYVPQFGKGSIPLFDDPRVKWLGEQLHGFTNKRILELGPLEGAHSFMMARGGADKIVAIEANPRAFLKCLIVKNALKFNVDFLLGDFQKYLSSTTDRYDFVLASGVLYHMSDPVELLANIARAATSVGIWTHYYDHDVISDRPALRWRFARKPAVRPFRGRQVAMYERIYLANENCFSVGVNRRSSYWLSKDGILDILDALGLNTTLHEIDLSHPHGPSLLLYATEKGCDSQPTAELAGMK